MKQLVAAITLAGLFISSSGFAAKKPFQAVDASPKQGRNIAEISKKISSKKISKTSQKRNSGKTHEKDAEKSKEKSVERLQAKTEKDSKWNQVCTDLLDTSVKATLNLEKSVAKKKKISKSEFEEKIQNELLVVQLNAWVCAVSIQDRKGASAEELFLQDYSKRVQSRKL